MDPISNTVLIDDTKPEGCELLSTMDDYMRNTREAVNYLFNTIGANSCGELLLESASNIINATGLGLVTLTTATGEDVDVTDIELDNESTGIKVVAFKVCTNNGDDLVTFVHKDDVFIMQNGKDAILGAGDFIIMQFCDLTTCQEIDARIVGGVWHEVGRTQARTPIGGTRFWPSIDQYGAFTSEGI